MSIKDIFDSNRFDLSEISQTWKAKYYPNEEKHNPDILEMPSNPLEIQDWEKTPTEREDIN